MTVDWSTSLQGKILKGHYRIDYKAAQGGMSWLYKVTHTLLQEEMALKLLYPHLIEDPQTRSRFIDEAKIQFQLNHPNIVRVTELIQEDRLLGIIQEWINGTDLRTYLRGRKNLLSKGELWYVLKPLLKGLHYAHEQGVVHRDIKPSNVLLSIDQNTGILTPKISDFGVAKVLSAAEGRTSTGMMLGTIKYVAPEQIRDSATVDRTADIYSMGVMIYRLSTGRCPFTGPLEKVLYKHLVEIPEPPSFMNETLDTHFDEVILKCLAKESKERYATCQDLAAALEAVLEPEEFIKAPNSSFNSQLNLSPKKELLDTAERVKQTENSSSPGAYRNPKGEPQTHSSAEGLSHHFDNVLSSSMVAQFFETRDKSHSGSNSNAHLPQHVLRAQSVIETRHGSIDELDLDNLSHMSCNTNDLLASDLSYRPTDDSLIRKTPKKSSQVWIGIVLLLVLIGGSIWVGSLVLRNKQNTVKNTPNSNRVIPPRRRRLAPRQQPKKSVSPNTHCSDGAERSCYTGPKGTQGVGACKAGKQTCNQGRWSLCKGSVEPQKERCNGRDDNCNGKVDEEYQGKGEICFQTDGGCRYAGIQLCHSNGQRLRCGSLRPAPLHKGEFIRIQLFPKRTRFIVQFRGKRLSAQDNTCIEVHRSGHVKISASRYQMCVFRISSRKRKRTLRMKRKSDLEDIPNYCVR